MTRGLVTLGTFVKPLRFNAMGAAKDGKAASSVRSRSIP